MKVKHNFLIEENCLAYISKNFSDNSKIIELINKQNEQIQQITSKLNYYEDALKNDVIFETNIIIKNIENNIDGKCLIHFFPKCIHFRIECKGNIVFKGRKEFEIEIIFPFKISELKLSSIEKLQGCLSSQKVQNLSEQETIRNYYAIGYLEQKKIDLSLYGILTFSSFKYDISLPLVLYNINQKKYICYENYKWKFIENCFLNDGNIRNNCIVNLDLIIESNEIYIKNQYKYLGNKSDFVTTEKNDAKYEFNFLNKFYGIISISYNNKFLSSDNDTGSIKLTNEQNYFIIYNV